MSKKEKPKKSQKDGIIYWSLSDGRLHKSGDPAFIGKGFCAWWDNGFRHRLDGPAWIHQDKDFKWFINGVLWYDKQ